MLSQQYFHICQRVGKHLKNVWAIWFHLFSSEYSNLDLIHIRETKESRTRTRGRAALNLPSEPLVALAQARLLSLSLSAVSLSFGRAQL